MRLIDFACPSHGRARTSERNRSRASTQMNCARRECRSSVTSSLASPGVRRRRTSPEGSTVGSKTPERRWGCMKPPAVQTPRRSCSASMTTSISAPGTVRVSNGFAGSTRCLEGRWMSYRKTNIGTPRTRPRSRPFQRLVHRACGPHTNSERPMTTTAHSTRRNVHLEEKPT